MQKIKQENKKQTYHEKFDAFYNSSLWKDLRARKFYDANGLCEMCLKEKVVRAGREVHHIVPIEDDWSKRLEYDNLILLCPDHHNQMHERISPLQKFLKEWEEI